MWNTLAPVYDRIIGRLLNNDITVIKQIIHWKKSDVVLDLGGGTGRVAEQLQALVEKIIVADPAEKMLVRAKRKGLHTQLLTDVTLPFPDQTFDVVTLIETFHHFKNQTESLKECYRVLKSGGIVLMEEPNPTSFLKHFLWVERLFDHVTYRTPKELKLLLQTIGFQVIKEQPGRLMYFTVAKK
ncbi:MAG: class I SAM-dependent methyltransferase [Candidatus Kerfeldbacteria bacterium]|nr:class I SAM-dependent methyltransferase [Candidatus Kerfeldbacteria bacterium]